jgi:hypothetical protein
MPINWRFIDDEDQIPPVDKSKGLRWPPGEPRKPTRSFAFDDSDGPISSYDAWEAAMQRKAAAQARERARLGLPEADYIDYGIAGEPKKPE